MVRLQESQKRFFVSIPQEKVKRLGLAKGDELDWDFNERGNLELTVIGESRKKRK
ncbi:MAG: hypothetical protein V1921_03725 [Candidatus Altiarchaeota archaeon]